MIFDHVNGAIQRPISFQIAVFIKLFDWNNTFNLKSTISNNNCMKENMVDLLPIFFIWDFVWASYISAPYISLVIAIVRIPIKTKTEKIETCFFKARNYSKIKLLGNCQKVSFHLIFIFICCVFLFFYNNYKIIKQSSIFNIGSRKCLLQFLVVLEADS